MTGIEFNRHIEDIPIYPAASTYAFEGELVKLASNETPYAPHPQVLEAVEAQLRTLNRYPDPEKSLLRRRIAERTGLSPGKVAVGTKPQNVTVQVPTVEVQAPQANQTATTNTAQ